MKFNFYALLGKLDRIEKKIDAVSKHLGLEIKEEKVKDVPVEISSELPTSVKEGLKIKSNPKGIKEGLAKIKETIDKFKK
jgi:hypothetical protein